MADILTIDGNLFFWYAQIRWNMIYGRLAADFFVCQDNNGNRNHINDGNPFSRDEIFPKMR